MLSKTVDSSGMRLAVSEASLSKTKGEKLRDNETPDSPLMPLMTWHLGPVHWGVQWQTAVFPSSDRTQLAPFMQCL